MASTAASIKVSFSSTGSSTKYGSGLESVVFCWTENHVFSFVCLTKTCFSLCCYLIDKFIVGIVISIITTIIVIIIISSSSSSGIIFERLFCSWCSTGVVYFFEVVFLFDCALFGNKWCFVCFAWCCRSCSFCLFSVLWICCGDFGEFICLLFFCACVVCCDVWWSCFFLRVMSWIETETSQFTIKVTGLYLFKSSKNNFMSLALLFKAGDNNHLRTLSPKCPLHKPLKQTKKTTKTEYLQPHLFKPLS